MINGLRHNAYRWRDSEEARAFYEDFLGLRMVSAFEINEGRLVAPRSRRLGYEGAKIAPHQARPLCLPL